MAAIDGHPVTLYVQQLVKLRSAGRTRRYEVLLRADTVDSSSHAKRPATCSTRAEDPASGGKLDRVVISELCQWLAMNRSQLEVDPAAFSVNLSTGALLDESFMGFVEKALRDARINPRQLGFEIRESAVPPVIRRTVARFLQFCETVGCHVVIDDFTFHSEVLPHAAPARGAHAEDRRLAHRGRAEGQGGAGAGGRHLAWLARAGHALRGQAHRIAHGAPVADGHRRGLRAGLPCWKARCPSPSWPRCG